MKTKRMITNESSNNVFLNNNSPLFSSDIEIHQNELQEREVAAEEALTIIGKVLDNASSMLDDVERNKLLGPAIVRCCNDLADGVTEVAKNLRDQSETDRLEFARALIADANLAETTTTTDGSLIQQSVHRKVSDLSAEEIVEAVSDAEMVLWDVEEVLRSVGKEEAEEIAEVGLTVAKLFVWLVRSFHRKITPTMLAGTEEDRRLMQCRESSKLSPVIEEIEMNDNRSDSKHRTVEDHHASKTRNQSSLPRMRILWPPIGPSVGKTAQWTTNAAINQPFLAAALAIALWPAALLAAFIGTPILAADWALQKGYDAASQNPILATMEHGASNLYQVGKLYFLCSKLIVKQGLKIGQKQIKRRGGVGKVAQDVGSFLLDRAVHPVETTEMAIDGVKTGVGAVMDLASFLKDVTMGNLDDDNDTELRPTDSFSQKEMLF